MKLPAQQLAQVRAGRKTQHRVWVQTAREVARKNGTSYTSRPFTPTVGHTVKMTSEKATPVFVTITSAHTEPLGTITFTDVLAEGHKTTDEFRAWWVTHRDTQWVRNQQPDTTGLLARFDDRHAERLVWAMVFTLDRSDRPRYIAKDNRFDHEGRCYTENPSEAVEGIDEPVDDVMQRWYTADAHERFQGMPGRREQALLAEAQNLSRRLKQSVRSMDVSDIEVAARLQRIRDEIKALEDMRRNAA